LNHPTNPNLTKNSPAPDARERLENVSLEQRQLFGAVEAQKQLISEDQKNLVFLPQNFHTNNKIGDPSDLKGPCILLSRGLASEYSGRKALLSVLEHSREYKEAATVIEPLLKEIAGAEAADLERRLAADAKRAELRTALKKAQQAAENDPKVAKAREALAALE
jgi:hypothetical protein